MPGSKGAGWLDARMEDAPAGAVMTSIRLERREPARNRQRFYTIAVTRTLFDGWAVVREWGRIGLTTSRPFEVDSYFLTIEHSHRGM